MRSKGSGNRLAWLLDERNAWVWLAAAMVASTALILWLNRGTTFWTDEMVWLLESPSLDLEDSLRPYLGHLVFTSHIVYKALFEAFGSSYVPFRLLGVATVLLTVGLFFAYARRRVGGFVALAPCLVLLLFGSDMLHVLVGNSFTVLLAVSCGLGALMALERRDGRGDAAACALLCLGVLSYSVALAFVVGAAALVLLDRDRWLRAWVVAVPIVVYGAWWLWALTLPTGPDSQTSLSNILLLPAWSFQSLSHLLSSLVGVSYQFAGGSPAPDVGPVLAVAALAALGWRLSRGSVPKTLWAALGVVVALWTMGALAAGGIRFPDGPRYLYPGAIAALAVAAGAVSGLRWSRAGMIGLYLVAIAGLVTNYVLLRDAAATLRDGHAVDVRSSFAAVEIAGPRAERFFLPPGPVGFPFSILEQRGEPPASAYFEAADRYGSVGYSLDEVRAGGDAVGARVDSALVSALGLELAPAPAQRSRAGCRAVLPSEPVALGAGTALLVAEGEPAEVSLRRFAEGESTDLGQVEPGAPAALRIPVDSVPEPWLVSADVETLVVCSLR